MTAVTPGPVDWLTPARVAERLKPTHVITVYKALESGELHGHQRTRGGRWSVHPDAVDAWVRGTNGQAVCGCVRLRLAKRPA